MLEVREIETYYGSILILKDISLHVNDGEIVAVVGSNGSGKSTILRSISGLTRPKSGYIQFLNKRIDTLPSYKIVEEGLVQIPEGRKIFPSLTVRENLDMGAYNKKAALKKNESLEMAYHLFPILQQREKQLSGTLSGGEQQMLAIARGLMSLPLLLMLDEPSLGLAPIVVEELFDVIKKINKNGTAILIVEQNVYQSLKISSRAYVLENGQIVLYGTSKDLLHNENVKKTYLGL